ncbi:MULTISPECIES: oxygenase MpaB family protein [unclassified Mycobacterium]|uniref:oxygenase MpaB family protein n=1 Tax=unclassified Mycobacterium TaxID=2642494 RepID=UPI0029C7E927|nr:MULTISPECIES: oxygenase MpaB family protein [unclassified Mycobacterium]
MSVSETSASTEAAHPFDYQYREGMPLRSAPTRAVSTWPELRRNLYGPWVDVIDGWDDTPQTRLLDDHMWEGDELMDDVVRMFKRVGPPTGRAMFERALENGIDSLVDPPAELVALFEQLDREPDWYDPDADARGRLRLAAATSTGKMAAGAFGAFATAREQDVSAATGSTGRLVRSPARRQVESSKFMEEITYRGALRRESAIFHTIIRVRLMHSLVRAGLRKKWGADNFAEHGMPISNTKMAAGSAWFATMPILADRFFGRPFAMHELDDVSIHWGYVLYLFGVNERIIPKSGLESIQLANHVLANAGEPSKWSAELAEALLFAIKDISGKTGALVIRLFLAGGATLLGADEMQKLVTGTTLEGVRIRRWVPIFQLIARGSAGIARVGDHLPPVREMRRRKAWIGDPNAIKSGRAVTSWGAKHGIDASPFTHHDDSISGSSFTRQ